MVLVIQGNSFIKKENITRVNRLIKETDFSYDYGSYSDKIFDMFTDEEILDIDCTLGSYLVRATRSGADIDRLRRLVSLNREIIAHDDTFNPYVLKAFSDEEFANMSKDFINALCIQVRIYFPKEWTKKEETAIRMLWNDYNKNMVGVKQNVGGVKQKFKTLITRG